ncbi:single-stranded DNA-binding protein, partial [bacterium]|nr:single-stranded DNA-binding protein [bacterium]
KNYEDRYFFNCVAWSQQAKYINDNLKKGTFVAVDGRLIKRSYVNSEGKTIYVVEIIVDSIKNYSSVNSTKNKANFEVIDTPIAIDEILNAPDQVLGQEQNNPSNDNEIDNKFD